MKKIIIQFTLLFISSSCLTAQNKTTKKADKHYDRFEFVEAAEEYAKIANKGEGDTFVYSRLAESYYNIFNTEEAEKWYAKALETSEDPEMLYKYSQMLKANGKYEESNEWMKKFVDMRPADIRAVAFRDNPDYLPKILEKGKKFNIQNLDFNTEYSDFGGSVNSNEMFFASARNTGRKTYGWNEEPFLDMYSVTINDDGNFSSTYLLENSINTKYHEGLATFSPDGNTMYFSRESYFENQYEKDPDSKNRYSVLQLFKSKKELGTWGNVQALSINSDTFSVKNPSLSRDGRTLYFASDMSGGYGLFDIYKAEVNSNGSIGKPENLGQKINTEAQEMFPFISENNTLYFSSNGPLGLGGLDVYHTRVVDGKYTPVRNIGIPINSAADDFAFTINEETEQGFVSSNRFGGKGSDDIYAIKKLQPLCDVLVTGTITDSKTGTPLAGATATLIDEQNNRISSKISDDDGKVAFIIECETDTNLEVVMDEYESNKIVIKGTSEEELNVSIALNPIEKLIVEDRILLNPIYFDFDKSNITSQAAFELDKLVQVMNKYPDIVLNATSHTDSRGNNTYNERLSDRRAKTTVQYVISKGIADSRISGIGKGENEPIYDCSSKCSEEEHQKNRRSEFIIISGGPNSQ